MTKLIGFGKCSKSYLYILFAFILKTLDDNYFTYTSVSPKSDIDVFKINPVLSNHIIVQNVYKYISFIIGGIIFKIIIKKNNSENNRNIIFIGNKHTGTFSESPRLLHYKRDIIQSPKTEIIIVAIIYALYFEVVDILYTFKLVNLRFWTLELIFIIIFLKKYFIIKFYNYQKCSFIFMISFVSILLISSSFLPVMEGDSEPKISYDILLSLVNNKYILLIIVIIIINCNPILISYARVRTKVLIDFKYISPYTIIIVIGIFGMIFTSIELIFGSFLKCGDNYTEFCVTKSLDNNTTTTYFDNLGIYFNSLGKKEAKELAVEIILLYPIFWIINFFELVCEFWVIIKLNPIFVLIQNNFAYAFNYLLYIIFNSGESKQKNKIIIQFVINEAAEIIALICYMIYLEIIELRFCGLDTYLNRNLVLLSNYESSTAQSQIEEEAEEEDIDSKSEYSLNSATSTIY